MENLIKEDLFLKTDKESFRSIFSNLLNNAIKYSPEGSVISFKHYLDKKSKVISIKDNGYGIEKKSIHRIFERFYRVDKGRSRKLGGTGLGLAIVKHAIDRNNARIEIESKLSFGSTFSIIFPKVNVK